MANEEFQILKQRSLFSKLKRLFSTDAVIRNVGGKKLKVVDTDEVMYATDRNTLRDRFNRIRTSSYNQYSRDFTLSYQASRIELFRDYDTMDMDPIIASALDIYADECVTKNELGEILVIHSSNDNIKQILYTLFYDIRGRPVKYNRFYTGCNVFSTMFFYQFCSIFIVLFVPIPVMHFKQSDNIRFHNPPRISRS